MEMTWKFVEIWSSMYQRNVADSTWCARWDGFLLAQQDETKKLMDYEIDLPDNFDFYLNKTIAPITNDKDDMDTHSTIVSDGQYALEILQSKN